MSNRSRSKPRSRIDDTLEDSFPASDPPGWNMGRDTPQAEVPAAKPKRSRQRSASAKRRVARADQRSPARAGERQMQGYTMPRGRRLLSPLAWLRWLLRRTVRPADRQA